MNSSNISAHLLALDRVTKNTKRVIDSILAHHGLRSTHASCFFRICETANGLTSTELAEACGVDKAFISRITAELTSGGYIMKDPSSKDIVYKRKYILTDKGTGTYNALVKELSDIFDKASKSVSSEKLAAFDEILNILDNNIINYLKGGI